MATLLQLFQLLVVLIMGITAAVNFRKKRDQIAALPYWIAIGASLGCWVLNILWGNHILALAAIGVDNFGFLLMAIGAMKTDRRFVFAGTVWFVVTAGFFYFANPYSGNLVRIAVLAILAAGVFWVGNTKKQIPMYVIIGMAVFAAGTGLIFGYLWRNISLACICYWLTQGNIIAATPKTTTEAPKAEIGDKLKSLELLQELRNSGVITQEEFDAKKKQLLGL